MQKLYTLCLVAVATVLAVQPVQPVGAVDTRVLTDAQLRVIRENCETVKVNLTTLHKNDAVLRVNLGQRYENISRRLMAPLNGRIAANNLDGVEKAQITVKYTEELRKFTTKYIEYETLTQTLMQTNCNTNMADFYRNIETARELRLEVGEHVDELQSLADQYRQKLIEFKRELEVGGGSNV